VSAVLHLVFRPMGRANRERVVRSGAEVLIVDDQGRCSLLINSFEIVPSLPRDAPTSPAFAVTALRQRVAVFQEIASPHRLRGVFLHVYLHLDA
jgi:hypothetical protein